MFPCVTRAKTKLCVFGSPYALKVNKNIQCDILTNSAKRRAPMKSSIQFSLHYNESSIILAHLVVPSAYCQIVKSTPATLVAKRATREGVVRPSNLFECVPAVYTLRRERGAPRVTIQRKIKGRACLIEAKLSAPICRERLARPPPPVYDYSLLHPGAAGAIFPFRAFSFQGVRRERSIFIVSTHLRELGALTFCLD